jgi:ribosomal protein L11
MNDFDPRYVAARGVLLDALFALAPHGKAVMAIAPYTTDGDLVINPSLLGDDPLLSQAMLAANFTLMTSTEGHEEPGIWIEPVDVNGETELIPVDLLVPHGVAPSGSRRAARLGAHGNRSARSATGLEAALVDHSPMVIRALDSHDDRSITVEVAGATALLVAKAHKIHDREASGREGRLEDKDASDVVRIMQTTKPSVIGATMSELVVDPIAGEASRIAIEYLKELFGRRRQPGIQMAGRALQLVMDYDTVEVICLSYIADLTKTIPPSAGRTL